MNTKITSVDEYIAQFPRSTQKLLKQIRTTIKQAAHQAAQKMAYGIPTFTLHGNLVHFGGYEHHIGFYPGANGVASFKTELSKYKTSKGTIQFPLDKPLPLALIKKIVRFRVKENSIK